MSKELIQAGLQGLAKTAADIYRGLADITEARGNNGVSTKVSRETSTTVSPDATRKETHTTNIETVDHAKRADYLRNVVATRIQTAFDNFGKDGSIRIGNQNINVNDIVSSVSLIAAGFLSGSGSTKSVDLNELFNQLKAASALAGEEPSAPVPTEEPSASATNAEETPTASKKRRKPRVEDQG